MANAGGAWDNAKKIVEVELKEKGTPLHDATASSATPSAIHSRTRRRVALNPVIKFTTLFGLLAVELAEQIEARPTRRCRIVLAAVFFVISLVFVYRSFYGMRIESGSAPTPKPEPSKKELPKDKKEDDEEAPEPAE